MIVIGRNHSRHNEEPKLYKFGSLFENPYGEMLPYYKVEVTDSSCWSWLHVTGSLKPDVTGKTTDFITLQALCLL